MKVMQVIESVNERDIDLIILEELNVNREFCIWMVTSLALPKLTGVDGAWRSVKAYGQGETDILFSYYANEDKIFVLIENKLDASFQESQSERYAARASKYCEDGVCSVAFNLLVAPEQYCENQRDFDRYLTYESIGEFLSSTGGERGVFKSRILDIAIYKLRRGFQAVNFPLVQEFWMDYWFYRGANFPTLSMKRPDIVPEGSDWPTLTVDSLPGVRFYHKLHQGNVDAVIFGFSQEYMLKLERLMPEKASIKYSENKVSIKIVTPPVYRHKDFQSQSLDVEAGLKQIEYLAELVCRVKVDKGL